MMTKVLALVGLGLVAGALLALCLLPMPQAVLRVVMSLGLLLAIGGAYGGGRYPF